MTPKTLLELGRVSNLPTVVSNVACGAALAGTTTPPLPIALTALAGCLFYVGGMVLNDAFDAEIDARERPERPIPSGRATRSEVFRLGYALLAGGLALLVVLAATGVAPSGVALPLSGLGTALAVVTYDRFHKGIALSPVVMGLCRAGLYVMGALAVSEGLVPRVGLGALVLLLYVVGLTHIARFETASTVGKLWVAAVLFSPLGLALSFRQEPAVWVCSALFVAWTLRGIAFARQGGRSIGLAVVSLIAGISLLDALLASSAESLGTAGLALAAWALTLWLQRWVRGT